MMKKFILMASAVFMMSLISCSGSTQSNDTADSALNVAPTAIDTFEIRQGKLDRSGVGFESVGIDEEQPIKVEVMADEGESELVTVTVPCVSQKFKAPKGVNIINLYLSYNDGETVKECIPLTMEASSLDELKKIATGGGKKVKGSLVFSGRMPKEEVKKLKESGKTVRTGLHDFNFTFD